jgi:hypothetical protein
MRCEWHIDEQTVSADLNLLTGRETIALDGDIIFDKISWKFRNEVPVKLRSGRDAKTVVRMKYGLIPNIILLVDGVEIAPTTQGTSKPVPWWGWVFVGACVVLPIVTVGGAIPAAVGFGGAALNGKIAGSDWNVAARVLAMSAVTLAAWILVFGLILALAAILGS